MPYILEKYVAQTRDFMLSSSDQKHKTRVDLAIDRLKYILLVFGGMGKPHEQIIDVEAVKIHLKWKDGRRETKVEIDDTPSYVVEWSVNGTKQRVGCTMWSLTEVIETPIEKQDGKSRQHSQL